MALLECFGKMKCLFHYQTHTNSFTQGTEKQLSDYNLKNFYQDFYLRLPLTPYIVYTLHRLQRFFRFYKMFFNLYTPY